MRLQQIIANLKKDSNNEVLLAHFNNGLSLLGLNPSFLKKDLDLDKEYIENMNKFEKENLYKKASKELTQINEEFFEIIWPIAISRSHSLPDKKDEASQSDLKIARLKTLYGN